MIQDSRFEGVPLHGLRAAHHPRQQPGDRFDHDERRHLAPAEHVVTDGQLLGGKSLHDPLIDTLVSPTDQDKVRLGRELFHEALIHPTARW